MAAKSTAESKPDLQSSKVIESNLSTFKKELLIKVSYSEHFGIVTAGTLDKFLWTVQEVCELKI